MGTVLRPPLPFPGEFVPVLPSCLLEPLWDQFAALLPEHVDTHPLGCHNPRVSDRVVFEHVIAALVHGSGYERSAGPGCSDRTIRRRVKYWAQLGMALSRSTRSPCRRTTA
ncbi:hypothetical protein Raf01_41200 [Rugosimonospora africana]|uniref:Transposase of IS4/5 family n=1 Tax=Rugosimonospora africana TaxID=556532 RepID=A0A8J3QS96_9ACTN|nr:hypothetical protein Raf01_41200 [Rugosimonospora africana]